jgi:hypothetical protein
MTDNDGCWEYKEMILVPVGDEKDGLYWKRSNISQYLNSIVRGVENRHIIDRSTGTGCCIYFLFCRDNGTSGVKV